MWKSSWSVEEEALRAAMNANPWKWKPAAESTRSSGNLRFDIAGTSEPERQTILHSFPKFGAESLHVGVWFNGHRCSFAAWSGRQRKPKSRAELLVITAFALERYRLRHSRQMARHAGKTGSRFSTAGSAGFHGWQTLALSAGNKRALRALFGRAGRKGRRRRCVTRSRTTKLHSTISRICATSCVA